MKINFAVLTDDEVIASLRSLVGDERRTVASVLRHLNEFDRRKLSAGKGFPSLFEYCVKELKYAQSEAGRRIQAARAAVKYPVLFKAIERGLLSLTVVSILAPHLKWDNYRKLIRAAKGLTTRDAVKDEVWARDGGRCVYPGEGGRLCGARAGLQFDHVKPWALGGSGEAGNIRLLCRTHNDLEARRVFGDAAIGEAVDRRRGVLRTGAEI